MHICFVSSEYPLWAGGGGVASFLQTFGRAMVYRGHQVSIVGTGHSQSLEEMNDEGVEIYRLPAPKSRKGRFVSNTRQINKKLRALNEEKKIDVIESAELGLAFIKKIPGVRFTIRLHGGHHFFAESENRSINKWKGFQEKRAFRKADGFIAVSEYVKTHTARYLSYHEKPVDVINNPIDTNMFAPDQSVKTDRNNVTFVGAVCEKKGIRQLIQAIDKLSTNYPDIHLHVYGKEWFFKDGSTYTEMLKKEHRSVIEKQVTFHGIIPFNQLPKKYAEAFICAFPSHMETQGLVAPEAMAMQKPVVFSKLGPGKETIEDYKTGLLCDPYDVDDIVEKVSWFIKNEDKIEAIGQNARAFVVQKFNLETVLDQNIDFYQKIIKA